jgi:hypothetical protein
MNSGTPSQDKVFRDMKSNTLFQTLAVSALAMASLGARAQTGSFDVSAGGGFADFFGNGSANRAKGTVEASAVYNFAAHVGAGFEYAYSPIDSYSTTYNTFGGSFNESGSDKLQHYGGVVRIPFAAGPRVEPFAAVHGGAIHETASASAVGGGLNQTASENANGGYVGTGLGVNLFVFGRLGVRPELRYEYLTESGSHLNEVAVTGSVFYRFGGKR